jgi:hypothetical protein
MPIPQRHKYEQHRKARQRAELEHEQMVEAFLADLPPLDEQREQHADEQPDAEARHD